MPAGTYTFLPFVRQGLGTQISGAAGNRPTMQVGVELRAVALPGGPNSATVTKQLQLYGPGDVVGIDGRQVIRTEPVAFAANFEPNYLAAVDFYDEDFPWRYTPAPPAGHRLTPWISLIVLTDDEFTQTPASADRPLPAISVNDAGPTLPRPDQLWAWAHVQVNRALPGLGVVSGDGPLVAGHVGAIVAADADLANARLVCPRQLQPSTGYHAFVVPTFEAGRRAGLGQDPSAAAPVQLSWGATGPVELPVYYRWAFRTGAVGDFEFLVRLLKPRPADARVGRRPLDVLDPGDGLSPIDDPGLGGVLQLGGALQVPIEALDAAALAERERFEAWDGGPPGTHPFQVDLAAVVNLADDYASLGTAGAPPMGIPDPVITPPLYGRWLAPTTRLATAPDGAPLAQADLDGWPQELNLDPRHRTAAAFGTAVVQANQEQVMADAWGQLGDVLAANRLIRWFGLGRNVSTTWHRRTIASLARTSPIRAVQVAGGVLGRVTANGATVKHQVTTSSLPNASVEGALRRVLRPNGRLGRRGEGQAAAGEPPGALGAAFVSELASGKLSAAPPRPDVAFQTLESTTKRVSSGPKRPGRGAKALLGALREFDRRLTPVTEPIGDPSTPVVKGLPTGHLVLSELEEPVPLRPQESDNEASARFKAALTDQHRMQAAATDAAAEPRRPSFDFTAIAPLIEAELQPSVTFGKRLRHRLNLPTRIIDAMVPHPDGEIDEVMAYPVFERPMYEPLVALSDELFLPNLQLIPENSITLLEPNRPFIESYLVGLNHEMARELLWREYPTDQRGSPFRQFWDAREQLRLIGDTPANREALRDIPPIHGWGARSELGDHDHRQPPGEDPRSLVLVIRGELLKRYPNAVIYAHRADWTRKADGTIDRTKPRQLAQLTAAQEAAPPRTHVRLPQYTASVKPDITFIGFDLDASEVLGETEGSNPDPGWFFVIKERPGEVRFGLDVDSDLATNGLSLWNDLAWEHLTPTKPGFAELAQTITLAPAAGLTGDRAAQRTEDAQVTWTPGSDAAEVAYVFYQVPVLVAVHGAELLRSRP
jgi:hypothetical protein